MKEEQFDFVANDFVDGIPSGGEEPEYEYLEIYLTKEMATEIYIKVPKGFDKKKLSMADIGEFLDDQDPPWEMDSDYSWHISRNVDEQTAEMWGYSEI